MSYIEFIKSKRHLTGEFGFDPVWMPDYLFDFQKYMVEKAVRRGRCATFADTGLGKTAMLLTMAQNIVKKTNGRVIILTPLAVAWQFVEVEAPKIGVDDIEYSKDGKFTKRIVVTNYERLKHFDPSDFEGVLLDESSILKNFDGAIKQQCTAFVKKVKYRQLCTATPSPNDFIELGTSSEALGHMGYTDMLGKFFTNNEDGTLAPQNIGTKWVLKGHAVDAFFAWVSSWSVSARKPSDLGFSDERHLLPELRLMHHAVRNEENLVVDGQIQLFNQIARRLTEVRVENKMTVRARCEKAVDLTKGKDCSVYWCNLNPEGDLLQDMDKDAVQIKGSMNIDRKEELLMAFAKGDIKRLITKAKMTAFGLNWQHCAHTVYFPTFSYEQYYQAIRRFWRFGQKRDVVVDLVYSDGQQRVLDSLLVKTEKANELFSKLNASINSEFNDNIARFNTKIQLPNFLN